MPDPSEAPSNLPPSSPPAGQPAQDGSYDVKQTESTPLAAPTPSISSPVPTDPLLDDSVLEIALEAIPDTPPPSALAKPIASRSAGEAGTTRSERAAAATAATDDDARLPFNRSKRIELPLAVAGCAAAIFIAACLGGQSGLFPNFTETPVSPGFGDRFLLVLRGLLLIVLCAGSLFSGAAVVQMVDKKPLGDLGSLAAQMLMISSISMLARILPFGIEFIKKAYDVLVPIGVAWVLVLVIFRRTPRDAGFVIGAAILSLIVLAFGSSIVSFAVWSGVSAVTTAK